jgi:hypothetical protein
MTARQPSVPKCIVIKLLLLYESNIENTRY